MSIAQEKRYYLKLKALTMLYEDGLTQTETAKRLHVSRVTLSKLLEEAKREGMIRIEIVDVRGKMRIVQLEKRMRETFGLRDVRLVDCENTDDQLCALKIAEEASAYVKNELISGMNIGLTWGRTLNAMTLGLIPDPAICDLTVYTLVGGASMSLNFQPAVLAQRFINAYSGKAVVITAPFMCQHSSLCEEIKKEPVISDIFTASRNLDMTLVGIGEEPERGSAHLSDYPFGEDIIQELVDADAVGDICGNFFDINGHLCDTALSRRIISIDISDLPHHHNVIGMGGGKKKVRSIVGALEGHYLHVLITDINTAEEVLQVASSLG